MPPSSGIWSGPSPFAERAPGAAASAQTADLAAKLHIRLTTPGTLAIALVLAAGIVAVNSGNNLLYLVVAGLLAALALSGVLGHRNLRDVALRLTPPDEIWAGRPVSVLAELHNPRRRLPAFLLALGETPASPAVVVPEILPGDRVTIDLPLAFPRRGRQPWPRLAVTSEFPFGLVRRGWIKRPPGMCLVYPTPIAVPWESVERAEFDGEGLARQTAGGSGDYRGQRDYAPGDSLSRVQWSSWLRLRRLQSKEFDAEGAPPVLYAFDAMPGRGTEERLGQLAWLVRTGLRRGRRVGIALPGAAIPPGSGPAHRRALLAALALFGEPPR